ncbi:MAG: SDR family NAD(P)-dependent oxidoreductase [bacterium]
MIGHKHRYALITGASSGIGYELAKVFAKDGKNLVIVARNENRLEEVKTEIESKYATKVKVLPKDLTDPKTPLDIFSELDKENIDVDVLVNNAGFGVPGRFSETDLQRQLGTIQLFTVSLTHLTKLFLKKMLRKKSGRILNVSSGMALAPVPLFSVYSACESYVLHFSEALANELQGTGVSVTCICPGQTRTSFYKSANVEHTKYGHAKMMDAATVAKAGYAALRKGKTVDMLSLKNQSLALLPRILPRGVTTKIMRWWMENGLKEAKS